MSCSARLPAATVLAGLLLTLLFSLITSSPSTARTLITDAGLNPAMGVILSGTYGSFSQPTATYVLPGFALGDEAGSGEEGLALGESEFNASANVDNQFHARLTAAIGGDDSIGVEEAFVESLALPHGFTVKAGRFFSGMGHLNEIHAHAWDFVDQPLVYRAMLGEQYGDDGIQLRWIAPTDNLLIQLGGEMFRGEGFPSGGATRNGRGARSGFVRAGGDIGTGWAWQASLSRLAAASENRATGDPATPDLFSGDTDLTIAAVVFKWAPDRNPAIHHFTFRSEYFNRREQGQVDPLSAGAPVIHDGRASGWFAQGVYQFMPRWRAGVRHDRLSAEEVAPGLAGSVLDAMGHTPTRSSVMVDFSNAEFSRLRLQFNRDESRLGFPDKQWFIQYQMSIGAHGAHAF